MHKDFCTTFVKSLSVHAKQTHVSLVVSYSNVSCIAGKGPIENLGQHLANPWAVNFATNGVSIPGL